MTNVIAILMWATIFWLCNWCRKAPGRDKILRFLDSAIMVLSAISIFRYVVWFFTKEDAFLASVWNIFWICLTLVVVLCNFEIAKIDAELEEKFEKNRHDCW